VLALNPEILVEVRFVRSVPPWQLKFDTFPCWIANRYPAVVPADATHLAEIWVSEGVATNPVGGGGVASQVFADTLTVADKLNEL
jgi:hypothetical protein